MSKPSVGNIQWGHPLARGMVFGLLFGEVGGTSIFNEPRDASNFNGIGAWFNTPTIGWVAGPRGAAYDFSTNGQLRWTAPKYPWVGNPTPCTVACGVKFKDNTSNGAVLTYGSTGPAVMLQRFNGLMYWEVNGTTNRVADVAGFTVNTWLHVAGTYDGDILRLYKEGVQQAQSTRGAIQITQGNNTFYVNDNSLGTAQNIILDYLYAYNRALTVAELNMLKVDPFQMFRGQSLLYTPPLVPLGPVAGGGPVVDYAVTGQRFAVMD